MASPPTLTIWKFPVSPERPAAFMPDGAQVLSCGMQGEQLVVWALVDPAKTQVLRGFAIFGTGHPVPYQPEEIRFVGTFTPEPRLWFHLFEVLS